MHAGYGGTLVPYYCTLLLLLLLLLLVREYPTKRACLFLFLVSCLIIRQKFTSCMTSYLNRN